MGEPPWGTPPAGQSGYRGAPPPPPPRPGYPGAGQGQWPYGRPADPAAGLATASLVCGIIAILFSVVAICGGVCFSVPLGIAAVVLGVLGRKSLFRRQQAVAGIVLGVVSLVMSVGVWVLLIPMTMTRG